MDRNRSFRVKIVCFDGFKIEAITNAHNLHAAHMNVYFERQDEIRAHGGEEKSHTAPYDPEPIVGADHQLAMDF